MSIVGKQSQNADNTARCADQQDIRRSVSENPIADHTRDVVDLAFEHFGIVNLQSVYVEDDIAVVGDKILAQFRLAAQFHHFARDMALRHGDDFNR